MSLSGIVAKSRGTKPRRRSLKHDSPYEGREVKGKVETVLSKGRVVIENGDHKGKQGDGKFLKRGTCVSM